MTDRIFVSNLCLHGFHGVHKAEKSLGQEETVHYGEVCDLAEDLSGKTVFNLIETFAERIADAILAKWDIVEEVTVTVRKPSAPIRHLVDHVGVSITRTRNG